ncbi:MAG: hypothetical protein LJE84_00935 [Gammaproteobacteria bacterium]|jgi:hypothetical protein|nr:hypothetical protein [Gammaproteobacteria bacterium]
MSRWALLICLVLAGAGYAADGPQRGLKVVFDETEPGLEPFPTRMIVTDAFLRVDSGQDDNEFLLFDRKAKVIYNVSAFNRAILVIRNQPVKLEPPMALASHREELRDPQPAHWREYPVQAHAYITNDKVCWRVDSVAEGPLLALRDALVEFHRVLAGEQAAIAADTPPEFQQACDLEHNVFRPDWYLAAGFPLRRDDLSGRVRVLREFEEGIEVSPALFALPAQFQRFSREQMTGD